MAVVIPAFNVEAHLAAVVRQIPDFVNHVIVVDDASRDNTRAVARACANADGRVRVVERPVNGGVGAAVLSGYSLALELGVDIVIKMDGDNQMDPGYAIDLIEPIVDGRADYTKGNRFIHSKQLRQMPVRRRIGNMGLSFLTKACSGYWDVFDPTNGYTAISAAALDALDWDRIDARYFFETSMLLELSMVRAVVRDVYIPAKYGDERSSLSERRALVEFPGRLLASCLRRVWLQYFVKEFSPVALFLIVGLVLGGAGLVWGIVKWVNSAVTGVEASTGTVMLAVVPLILGVQFLLQAAVIDIQNVPASPLTTSRRRLRRRTPVKVNGHGEPVP